MSKNQISTDGVYDNDAFRRGQFDYRNGSLVDDNPYPLFSEEADEWLRGMTEAALEDGVRPL